MKCSNKHGGSLFNKLQKESAGSVALPCPKSGVNPLHYSL